MQWSIVLGGALVPPSVAADVARAADAPRLAQRLSRARLAEQPAGRAENGEASHLAFAARAFGAAEPASDPAAPLVTAPYAWSALAAGPPPPGTSIWFCDPVHFEIARDHIVLHPLDHAPLDEAEAEALAVAAAPIAAAHGCDLLRAAGCWFIALPDAWTIVTHALAAASGRSIDGRLPAGPDAARWRRLLTEIQIQWHEHPVNLARAAREVQAVNGLWLHGGGDARPLPRGRIAQAIARDPTWRGWAAATGAAAIGAANSDLVPTGDVIEDCGLLVEPNRAEHWGLWLERLAEVERLVEARCEAGFGRFSAIELVLCGDGLVRRVRLSSRDGWRRWRHHRLEHVLADGDGDGAGKR